MSDTTDALLGWGCDKHGVYSNDDTSGEADRYCTSCAVALAMRGARAEIARLRADLERLQAALLFCDELSRGDEGRINYLTSALGLYEIPDLLTDGRRAEFEALMYRDLDGEP